MDFAACLPLTFTVAANAKDLYDGQDDQEDGDPDANIDVISPELDSKTGSRDLKGKDDEPADGVVPADGKAPASPSVYHTFPPEGKQNPRAYQDGSMNRRQ
jgi:hypothetical protein